MKIDHIKQVFTLDEKTLEVRKLDEKMAISIEDQEQGMKWEYDNTMNFKGAPTSPITVPEDVKKQAKSLKI
ncbi:hypothetical protein J2Z48_001759 [Croceifilum oryzae]|uniref:Uncharacterized protein n=1 Tax=Croceifilum oryzae TaxID=1553429 RepID=A0AAJ1TN37_9BACL|nr:DUF6612 family protein [Croceifilum oryzae]MDQ0417586.1 hypothetical protein [Croceifilum oryzae]